MTSTTVLATWQFFTIVKPVPRLMRWTFGVVTLASALRVLVSPDAVAQTLLPILLLQTFAVSTGFIGLVMSMIIVPFGSTGLPGFSGLALGASAPELPLCVPTNAMTLPSG